MASYNNFHYIEPCTFRSTFVDSWHSHAFARDTETLTRALQKSLSGATSDISPFLDLMTPEIAPTPTVSTVSVGSDPETALKRQRNSISVTAGRVAKRKSRASKRTQTTFINVDHANFRQMVQQVTGVGFSNLQATVAPTLKPEPHRLGSRLSGGGCLPTLDTSAFLLEHHQSQMIGVNGAGLEDPLTFGAPAGMSEGGSAGLDFDPFCSFPTLDSWKVM